MRACVAPPFAVLAVTALAPLASAADPPPVEANRVAEVAFTAKAVHADPFNTVDLDVVFTAPDGGTVTVPAFWAGGATWKARYASPAVGTHTFRTVCSASADAGLHGVTGAVEVRPYRGDNPLYRHGPVRVAADRRHFAHADGTPFFWLGDTWWMGLADRLKWPAEFQTLTADRRAKGFTVVQVVAGLYPDMGAFDPRGRNEAGFPWEPGYRQIRPEYFDRADERLAYLADQGIVPCIVGAWGYHLPWLGPEKMRKHWRYVIARSGALPVVWCVAGEFNLPWYLEPGFPQGGEKQAAGWEELTKSVRKLNGFGRPVTIHPTGLPPLSGRGVFKDQTLLDFDMLQTGHGGREVLAPTIRTLRESYAAKPTMPVVNAEVSYEALLGRIPADIPRLMFWTNVLAGAAGHTYGANGIWQLNRKGDPYGKSPHGGTYGPTPWDEAMALPGSGQIGLGKKFLEQYPWPRFEPHQEWAGWADGDAAPAWGDWVWFPEGDPTTDAPVAARYFRVAFDLPADATVERAVLRLAVDDRFTAHLNGREVGTGANWQAGSEFPDAGRHLRPGRNVLAVRAENGPGPKNANPAGLTGVLDVTLAGGGRVTVQSGGAWRCADRAVAGWQQPGFDDGGWRPARVVAPFGGGPWGTNVGKRDEFLVPYAAGVPGEVRVVYSPLARPVTVRGLEPNTAYAAVLFDPVTGRREAAGPVRPDAKGAWTQGPPRGATGDWVVALDARPGKP